MAPSPEPQPGDWHETLVDLLAMDRGIPEDRARRFLARHAEEVRAAAPDIEGVAASPGLRDAAREELGEAQAAIARVHALVGEWEFMSGRRDARRELLAALAGEQR